MKRYAEILCRTYAEKISSPMQTVVIRPSNVYGPYDKFDFAVSHVTAALLRRVNLLAVRSSLHRAPPFPRLGDLGRSFARAAGRIATDSGEARRGGRVDRIIRNRLADLDLAASNRRLSSRLGIDLAEFGWID